MSKNATLKRVRGDGEPSTLRAKAQRLGETAYLTVAIQKKSGMKFTWRDSTTGWGNDDRIAYKRGYTCNSDEFESIESHDAYWENATDNYNRQYVIALADSTIRQEWI
jgi:hypothetical protein